MQGARLFLVIFSLLYSANAFYKVDDPVTVLDSATFEERLRTRVWLVEFFAPWCGHCRTLKPEWIEVGKVLQGSLLRVGAVDVDANKEIGIDHGITSLPTIQLMYHDGQRLRSIPYHGDYDATSIVDFAVREARALSVDPGIDAPAGSEQDDDSGEYEPPTPERGYFEAETEVYNFSNDSFPDMLRHDEFWFIAFVSEKTPYGDFCAQMKAKYIAARGHLEGKALFGSVHCDENKELCEKYGVRSFFPTIKFFGDVKRQPLDFTLPHTTEDLVRFANEMWEARGSRVEVHQIFQQDVWEKRCIGSVCGGIKTPPRTLCFVAFVPSLLLGQATRRNELLDVVAAAAEELGVDRMEYTFLWAQRGDQLELEGNVNVDGHARPALVAYSPESRTYKWMRGNVFEVPAVKDFIGHAIADTIQSFPIKGSRAYMDTVPFWDGLDNYMLYDLPEDSTDAGDDDEDEYEDGEL